MQHRPLLVLCITLWNKRKRSDLRATIQHDVTEAITNALNFRMLETTWWASERLVRSSQLITWTHLNSCGNIHEIIYFWLPTLAHFTTWNLSTFISKETENYIRLLAVNGLWPKNNYPERWPGTGSWSRRWNCRWCVRRCRCSMPGLNMLGSRLSSSNVRERERRESEREREREKEREGEREKERENEWVNPFPIPCFILSYLELRTYTS